MSEHEDQHEERPIRVLLISYHFAPLNVIASYRPVGFAKHLQEHGFETTVVTMDWERELHEGPSDQRIPVPDDIHIVAVRRERDLLQRLVDRSINTPILSTATAFLLNVLGTFNTHVITDLRAMERSVRKLLTKERYDVVISSASPDEHHALGAWCARKHGMYFVADYRDPYDRRALKPNFKPTLRYRIQHAIRRSHHRKWVAHAHLLTSVSAPWTRLLQKDLRARNALEVRNGYGPEIAERAKQGPDQERFILLYSGRIFPDQDLSPFFSTIDLFLGQLTDEDRAKVSIEFHGIGSETIAKKIHDFNPECSLRVTIDRIPKAEIIEKTASSSILLIFDYAVYGVYSGKLMEYAGANRNILMVPSDDSIISGIITDGNMGLASSDPVVCHAFLLERFREWKEHGKAVHHPIAEHVQACSQAYNVALLARRIRTDLEHRRQPQ